MYLVGRPHPQLTPFIRCYWSMTQSGPPALLSETGYLQPFHVLPDGCIELIIHFGVPHLKWDRSEAQSQAFIAGQITRSIWLAPMGGSGVFAVRFQPHGLHRFTSIPIDEFTDREIDLTHLWPTHQSLIEPILEAPSFETRCTLADTFLLNQLTHHLSATDNRLAWCLAQPHFAMTRIGAFAREAGLSIRQLERRFLRETGLTPKRYARIVRLQQAVNQIDTGLASNLTTLAYELGFADQAHMTRDFKQLTGLTPSQYLDKKAPLYFDSNS